MFVEVAVPFPVAGSFHYRVPDESVDQLSLGSVVEVPFGKRETHAFVLGLSEKCEVAESKIKTVAGVLSATAQFDAAMLAFLKWVAEYYACPLGEVIGVAIPSVVWKLSPARSKRSARSSGEVVALEYSAKVPTLTDEQSSVLSHLFKFPEKPSLLHGVTGSGKTEVYIRLIEAKLSEGKGSIVLVPEIALTPQLLGRFSSRFPGKVAVLHSELTPRERYVQWERVRTGESPVAIGARSAVFAPVPNLGLVIVDEEHEPSFKQEDSVRYHARDLAVVRAKRSGAQVVLGSATPSLESFLNAQSGRFHYLQMKKRVENRPLPKLTLVNIRDKGQLYESTVAWLTRELGDKIAERLAAKQQTLLYLNRLGFANFLYCEDCGHTWRCRNCDVALTYYQHPPALKCHYCGMNKRAPHSCEECSGTKVKPMGFGTEQVEQDLKGIFPNARIERMDRSVIKTRSDLETLLTQMNRGEVDILIGTQMVTKGHDFPGVSLVGILLADATLNLPDFRANERTFQVVTQVSGRAGRAQFAGEVVVQTVNPENPILQYAALNQAENFYRTELASRAQFGFPPYHRMAMLRFQHANPERVAAYATEVSAFVSKEVKRLGVKCQILGPSEAPLARLKKLYRWQCLLKSETVSDLHLLLKHVEAYRAASKTSVGLHMDVDPMSSM